MDNMLLMWEIMGPNIAGTVFGAGWWFWVDAVTFSAIKVSFFHYLSGTPTTRSSHRLLKPLLFLIFPCSLEDEPAEIVGTSKVTSIGISGTASIGLKLEASMLEDYKLTHDTFSGLLFPTNANKLLREPGKIIRKKTLDYFIWVTHYINGYMEHSVELYTKAKKYKIDAEMLKGTRDKAIKVAEKAFMRANATERRVEDIEAALRGAMKENSQLLAT
ncbi:hypothetical protein COCNU_13G007670 [Cocos nucifera]|uniref:Uncharacterized protein n=1 Tax=Cocos nucifera TaxID=13894 RepID=A0A8K0NBR0_COCNU|nr:hypothetical protein COCNU_13G007670 [Cocos nucifera]